MRLKHLFDFVVLTESQSDIGTVANAAATKRNLLPFPSILHPQARPHNTNTVTKRKTKQCRLSPSTRSKAAVKKERPPAARQPTNTKQNPTYPAAYIVLLLLIKADELLHPLDGVEFVLQGGRGADSVAQRASDRQGVGQPKPYLHRR